MKKIYLFLFAFFFFSFSSVLAYEVEYLNPSILDVSDFSVYGTVSSNVTNSHFYGFVPSWGNDEESAELFCESNGFFYVSHELGADNLSLVSYYRSGFDTLYADTSQDNNTVNFLSILCDNGLSEPLDFTETNVLLISIENKLSFIIELSLYTVLSVLFFCVYKLGFWLFTKLYFIYPYLRNIKK